MPTLSTQWIVADLEGLRGGEAVVSVSNSEPSLIVTVRIPGEPDRTEALDFQPILNRWVADMIQDRAMTN